MSELKPCPFCGADRASTYHIRDGRVAMCPACGAKGGSQFNGPLDIPSANDRAILAWNARADLPPTLSAAMELPEVKELMEAMERAIEAIDAAYDGPDDNGAYTVRERAALAAIKEPKT